MRPTSRTRASSGTPRSPTRTGRPTSTSPGCSRRATPPCPRATAPTTTGSPGSRRPTTRTTASGSTRTYGPPERRRVLPARDVPRAAARAWRAFTSDDRRPAQAHHAPQRGGPQGLAGRAGQPDAVDVAAQRVAQLPARAHPRQAPQQERRAEDRRERPRQVPARDPHPVARAVVVRVAVARGVQRRRRMEDDDVARIADAQAGVHDPPAEVDALVDDEREDVRPAADTVEDAPWHRHGAFPHGGDVARARRVADAQP